LKVNFINIKESYYWVGKCDYIWNKEI